MNYLKDYFYESNKGVEDNLSIEEKYKSRWTVQLYMNDNLKPEIRSFCEDHQEILFCTCKDKAERVGGMIMCEFCCIWYHYGCLNDFNPDDYNDKDNDY
jgi:hypothetical protein